MRPMMFLAALLVAATPAAAETLTIAGEVTYLERIALPSDGTLRISLVDLQTPEQTRVRADGAIATPGQVPLSFRFNLDDKVIATDRQYGIRAEILTGAQVLFRNAEPVPVDLAAAQGLQVVVQLVGETVAPRVDTAPLLAQTWTAIEIGGLAVEADESSFSIAPDLRVGGRGFCNSYFSQAALDGARLSLAPVASTKMACSESVMAQEAVFFSALAETRSWRITEMRLELLDGNGAVLMRLRPTTR